MPQVNNHQKTINMISLCNHIPEIEKDVANGICYLVLKNNKPIFRILPYQNNLTKAYLDFFKKELEDTGVYKNAFIKKMVESEKDILRGRLKNINQL